MKVIWITHDDVFTYGVHVVIGGRQSVAFVDDFERPLAWILHDQADLRRWRNVEYSLSVFKQLFFKPSTKKV